MIDLKWCCWMKHAMTNRRVRLTLTRTSTWALEHRHYRNPLPKCSRYARHMDRPLFHNPAWSSDGALLDDIKSKLNMVWATQSNVYRLWVVSTDVVRNFGPKLGFTGISQAKNLFLTTSTISFDLTGMIKGMSEVTWLVTERCKLGSAARS